MHMGTDPRMPVWGWRGGGTKSLVVRRILIIICVASLHGYRSGFLWEWCLHLWNFFSNVIKGAYQCRLMHTHTHTEELIRRWCRVISGSDNHRHFSPTTTLITPSDSPTSGHKLCSSSQLWGHELISSPSLIIFIRQCSYSVISNCHQ